jgi:hypothetical protein
MNPEIKFLSQQTAYGVLHTLHVVQPGGGMTKGNTYRLMKVRPAQAYILSVRKTYLAKNGTAWRTAVLTSGEQVAWKSAKFSQRFGRESYRMRSVPGGYKGDYVTSWSRAVNGKTYSFSRIFWNAGQDGATLRIYEGQSTKVIHEWTVKGPVSMKGKKH